METKLVCMAIEVPVSKYCWKRGSVEACAEFDYSGAKPVCHLDFSPLLDTGAGIVKAKDCASLKPCKEGT